MSKKIYYIIKKKIFTINFGSQRPVARGVLRLFLKRSGESVVKAPSYGRLLDRSKKKLSIRIRLYRIRRKIVKNVQFVNAKLFIICFCNYSLYLMSFTLLVRLITYISINEVSMVEIITSTQKTLCMDLPTFDPNEFIRTLFNDAVTKPYLEKGNLLVSLTEFADIVQELHWEFERAQILANAGRINDGLREIIEDQIVPERWEKKLKKLNVLIDNIVDEYRRLDGFLIRDNWRNPYATSMQQHIDVLETVRNNINHARLSSLSLEDALVNLRQKVLLFDSVIPDNISIMRNIDDPVNSVISDITPSERLFDFPALRPGNLIRDLFVDETTRPKFLETKLLIKIDKFNEIALDLYKQFSKSQKLMLSNGGNLALITETPEVQKMIKEQIVPERWEFQLEDMEDLIRKISMAYLRTDINSAYTESIREHENVLEGVVSDMRRASRNLEPLRDVMADWRRRNDLALEDDVSLPSNVYIEKKITLKYE